MATAAPTEAPASCEEAAELLRLASESARTLSLRGGGTKLGWGRARPQADVEVRTGALARVVEHNAGDLTAVIQAGAPLAAAQAVFAEAGQMLALDPPLGADDAATIGGVVATGDSGPARHRYGGPRDLLLGITVALPDGTVARAGGKVIKNVAGYDLAKLFAGSFGTLGLILEAVVRLHPLPRDTATAVGRSGDPGSLERAASVLAHAPLELESLDVSWRSGQGAVLARFGGLSAGDQADGAAASLLREAGLEVVVERDDDELWRRQRAGQRSPEGVVVRVAGLPARLARLLRAAGRLGGSVVGRAGLGISWVVFEGGDPAALAETVAELRRELAPAPCVVLDAPADLRDRLDVWGPVDESLLRLSRRVKERFDPRGLCNPGLFVGGL
jgi:glycolate oxidase FAD binding subunit